MAKKSRKKIRKKSKYAVGGTMYDTNTIPVGLQTKNLVAEESNPEILKAKQQELEEQSKALTSNAEAASDKIAEDQITADQNIEAAAAASEGQADAIISTAKTIGDKFVKPENRVNPFSDAVGAYRGVRSVNLAAKAQKGINAGVQTLKQAQQGAKAVQMATKASKIPVGVAAPQTVSSLAEGARGASAVGAGLKNFATSGAGIGTIASLAGAGVSKLTDDKDATTLTFGEGSGKVLSGIGTGLGAAALTGMALGSAVPVIGNIIGGVVGAGFGLIKGLTGRNKARKLKQEQDAEQDAFVAKTNKSTGKRFGSQLSSVQAAKLKAKTFSGYNQGFNTLQVKKGGLRLGMPRY
jgi:hypothetical protein